MLRRQNIREGFSDQAERNENSVLELKIKRLVNVLPGKWTYLGTRGAFAGFHYRVELTKTELEEDLGISSSLTDKVWEESDDFIYDVDEMLYELETKFNEELAPLNCSIVVDGVAKGEIDYNNFVVDYCIYKNKKDADMNESKKRKLKESYRPIEMDQIIDGPKPEYDTYCDSRVGALVDAVDDTLTKARKLLKDVKAQEKDLNKQLERAYDECTDNDRDLEAKLDALEDLSNFVTKVVDSLDEAYTYWTEEEYDGYPLSEGKLQRTVESYESNYDKLIPGSPEYKRLLDKDCKTIQADAWDEIHNHPEMGSTEDDYYYLIGSNMAACNMPFKYWRRFTADHVSIKDVEYKEIKRGYLDNDGDITPEDED